MTADVSTSYINQGYNYLVQVGTNIKNRLTTSSITEKATYLCVALFILGCTYVAAKQLHRWAQGVHYNRDNLPPTVKKADEVAKPVLNAPQVTNDNNPPVTKDKPPVVNIVKTDTKPKVQPSPKVTPVKNNEKKAKNLTDINAYTLEEISFDTKFVDPSIYESHKQSIFGIGTFQNDTWKGKFTFNGQDQSSYIGQGTVLYGNGAVFEGNFVDGELEGWGRYTFGVYTYVGFFKDGMLNGPGKMKSSFETFEGNFINNQLHGQGKKVVNGITYGGNFSQNKLNGVGYRILANGKKEDGTYKDDVLVNGNR